MVSAPAAACTALTPPDGAQAMRASPPPAGSSHSAVTSSSFSSGARSGSGRVEVNSSEPSRAKAPTVSPGAERVSRAGGSAPVGSSRQIDERNFLPSGAGRCTAITSCVPSGDRRSPERRGSARCISRSKSLMGRRMIARVSLSWRYDAAGRRHSTSRGHHWCRLWRPLRRAQAGPRRAGPGDAWSIGATSTCSSRCFTRLRPARWRPARSPSRCARSCGGNETRVSSSARQSDIDPAAQEVVLSDGGRIGYDSLIVATGARFSYFGNDAWAQVRARAQDRSTTPPRSGDGSSSPSRRPSARPIAARRAEWMTFVIVGGGPTGVELAGALGEIAHDTLRRDFRNIDPADARIVLVEAMDRVAAAVPARSVGVCAAPAGAPRRHGPDRHQGRRHR